MSSHRSTIRSRMFSLANSEDTSPLQNQDLTMKGHNTQDSEGRTNVYRVSTSSLTTNLRRMREVGQHKIEELSGHDRQIFNNLAELLSLISVGTEYNHLLSIVDEVFDDYQDRILPETVAAYFRGCFVDDNFGGSSACSAICAGSVKPPNMTESTICPSAVATLSQSGLRIDTNGGMDNGNIIVHIVNNAEGLTRKEIKSLKDDGYKTVTIYKYGTHGYTVKQSPMSINKIIPIDGVPVSNPSPVNPSPQAPRPESSTDYYNNNLTWIIVIVGVLILIVLIGFMMKKNKSWNSVSYQSPFGNYFNTNY